MEARFRSRPTRIEPSQRTDYLLALQGWNGRLAAIQRSVRVLEAVRWSGEIERDFFAHGGRELPSVSAEDYRRRIAGRDLERPLHELRFLAGDIKKRLGSDDPASRLLLRRARSCTQALRLIVARGTTDFARLTRDIYGTTLRSTSLRSRLSKLIAFLEAAPASAPGATITAAEAAVELARRLQTYFGSVPVGVRLVEALAADACAGGNALKLRRAARFSRADVDLLEVHEGWVHLGTTFNGRQQPVFAALGVAAPGATATQEGLAVLTELIAGVCHAARRRRLALRLRGVMMAEDGANFLQVFQFMRCQNLDEREAYRASARVYRGSLPAGIGPFTKDLSYGLGLIALADHLRSAGDDAEKTIALLFGGKTALEDLDDLEALHATGLLAAGEFVPAAYRQREALQMLLMAI